MFYLFDFAKVVIFLPFTKYFCNYFCFRHYFFLFTLLYRRTAAPLRTISPHRPGIHSSHRHTHDRHTLAPSGMPHALRCAPSHPVHPRPAWGCVFAYCPVKSGLHQGIDPLVSAAVAARCAAASKTLTYSLSNRNLDSIAGCCTQRRLFTHREIKQCS